MTIGWGIIGIGRTTVRINIPALSRAEGTKLVAVCDVVKERATDVATKHGIEHVYDSLENMLGDPELDALYIATPNSLHAKQTIEAAEAGKHVLCEKPMTITVLDAELMVEACEKNKVKLGVCYQHRYHPAHIEARRYIQSGIVGDINVAKAQLCARSPVKGVGVAGALMGPGVHCIDLLPYLLDSNITEVRALTDEEPPHRPVDEMVYAILKFESGAHGIVISGGFAPPSDNDAVIYGSKAKVTCKETLGPQQGNLGQLLVDGDSLNVRMTFPTDEPGLHSKIRTIETFNKCIEEDTELYISGDNGLQMVKITNAIIDSSRQGKAVKIL